MADIARHIGVDRSTVSLALRQQPRIPAATQARVAAAAASLGYTPDPLLGAFNLHRVTRRAAPAGLAIALVSDLPSRRELERSDLHREVLAGARTAAGRLGFAVTVLFTGAGHLPPRRLDQVLRARGIPGVIVAGCRLSTTALPLSWSRYSAVAIESFYLQPPLDALTIDYRAAARDAVDRLCHEGHRRIGFLGDADESARLQHMPLAGYLLAQSARGLAAVPPLLPAGPCQDSRDVVAWVRQHRLTAVLIGAPELAAAPPAGLPRSMGCVRWAGLFAHAANGQTAFARLGARAVERVVLFLQHGVRGLPAAPSMVLLPASAPPAAAGAEVPP
jgi:DNA-binding LacI/PurR family transcriptional regulator